VNPPETLRRRQWGTAGACAFKTIAGYSFRASNPYARPAAHKALDDILTADAESPKPKLDTAALMKAHLAELKSSCDKIKQVIGAVKVLG
jgi:hypothetical protein